MWLKFLILQRSSRASKHSFNEQIVTHCLLDSEDTEGNKDKMPSLWSLCSSWEKQAMKNKQTKQIISDSDSCYSNSGF